MRKAVVVIFALLLAACDNKTPRPKTEASVGPSAAAAGGMVRVDDKPSAADEALAGKVKEALASNAGPEARKIEVDANSGVVRLKGQVENDEAKQRIHEVANKVPGVKWVQNQISVAPPPRSG